MSIALLKIDLVLKNLATPARRLEPEALAGSVPTNIGQSVEALSV